MNCLEFRASEVVVSENEPKGEPRKETSSQEIPKELQAAELFGEAREIWIVLDGVRYRLRITRRGKMILQK